MAGAIPELGGKTAVLMDRLLARMDLSRPIAAIVAPDVAPAEVQEFLESLEEWLGAEAGVLELDSDLEVVDWEDSGLLILIGDDHEAWTEALHGDPGRRLEDALDRGAVILAIGGAAGVFGGSLTSDVRPGTLLDGLGWLPAAMVLTDVEQARSPTVRAWLQDIDRRLVLALQPDSILALGPHSEVEPWSEAAPEVVLGKGWEAR